ncbi:MAG TPA: TraM recognition domain-containing protein [Bdellovibrionota bacterium]|nr:TraM recognition domain-containing protein [Bdellovibrionota bacterium]
MTAKKENDPEQMIAAAGAVAALALFPVVFLATIAWKSPEFVAKNKGTWLKIGIGLTALMVVSFFLFIADMAPWRIAYLNHEYFLGITAGFLVSYAMLAWGVGSGLVFLAAPFVLRPKKKDGDNVIRTADFKDAAQESSEATFRLAQDLFVNSNSVPVAFNLKTEEVVMLDQARRRYHVLALGGTGMGKSNLMMILILHALYHEQPCIIIDPKGDESFISELRKLAARVSPLCLRRLKIFRLSRPDLSPKYNPLRYGTASQIKDKLLEALNWSEQYYQSISSEFLSEFVSAAVHLGFELNLSLVRQALAEETKMKEIIGRLEEKGNQGDEKARTMGERLHSYIGKIKKSDLLGLAAQLSVLDSQDIGPLLSFDPGQEDEIDLREVYNRNLVAYFQLDTLGNADTSRRLGRMIIEDVKSLIRYIYSTTEEGARKFVPFLIDEFGSFATKEFIETLKQARGARVSAHLFTQGLEDLDAVTHEFARQATSNPATIVALRLNDNKTVEEICAAAGTTDTFEQSFQVEQGIMGDVVSPHFLDNSGR